MTLYSTLIFSDTFASSLIMLKPAVHCDGMNVEVKLRTDDYPGETYWTLTNECGANKNINEWW